MESNGRDLGQHGVGLGRLSYAPAAMAALIAGAAVALLLGTYILGVAPARAAVTTADAAAQQLADKYSPIVMVRKLTDLCDSSEEQYSPPTTVNTVLGNPGV